MPFSSCRRREIAPRQATLLSPLALFSFPVFFPKERRVDSRLFSFRLLGPFCPLFYLISFHRCDKPWGSDPGQCYERPHNIVHIEPYSIHKEQKPKEEWLMKFWWVHVYERTWNIFHPLVVSMFVGGYLHFIPSVQGFLCHGPKSQLISSVCKLINWSFVTKSNWRVSHCILLCWIHLTCRQRR